MNYIFYDQCHINLRVWLQLYPIPNNSLKKQLIMKVVKKACE